MWYLWCHGMGKQMTGTPMKRDEFLDYTKTEFERNVRDHEMSIILDNGAFRHVVFRHVLNGRMLSDYHFNITTWPGYLCISGDMGTYVFSRMRDMFEFFRNERNEINPDYWGSKVQSQDKNAPVKEFSWDKLRETVEYNLETISESDWLERVDGNIVDLTAHIFQFVDMCENHYSPQETVGKIMDFEYMGVHPFREFYEYNFERHTYQFLWCCHAIVWGIGKYYGGDMVSTG